MSDAYGLFQQGCALLANGNPHAACVPLAQARDAEPDKASIRETFARALFSSRHYAEAAGEFEAALAINPANDYAHYGLAMSVQRLGDRARALVHLKLAVAMAPQRAVYGRALEHLSDTGAAC